MVLNSPLVNYLSNCDMVKYAGSRSSKATCAGYIPSYAMTNDFFNRTRGADSQEEYLQKMRTFVQDEYIPNLRDNPTVKKRPADRTTPWQDFVATGRGTRFLNSLAAKTGISAAVWKTTPNYGPGGYRDALVPNYHLGRYDARMKVSVNTRTFSYDYEPDDYINDAFTNQLKTFFPDSINYQTESPYEPLNHSAGGLGWLWTHRGSVGIYSPASVADLQEALVYNRALKLLILHGYEDVATPGYQTELDLKEANLFDRVPIKWFEGGHMIYNTEASRDPLKKELDKYYDDPNYSAPPVSTASN
jgi:hypothetical protein